MAQQRGDLSLVYVQGEIVHGPGHFRPVGHQETFPVESFRQISNSVHRIIKSFILNFNLLHLVVTALVTCEVKKTKVNF